MAAGNAAPALVDARSRAVIAGLEQIKPEFILELPSSTLKAILAHFLDRSDVCTFPIPREEEGVGILSGLVLAGRRAVMVIQDNGIGNLITALATFPQAYHIPMLIVTAAQACGIKSRAAVGADELRQALNASLDNPGPILLRVPVGTEAPPTAFFLEDPVVLAEGFRRWLRGTT